jgi:transposase InsO family protein
LLSVDVPDIQLQQAYLSMMREEVLEVQEQTKPKSAYLDIEDDDDQIDSSMDESPYDAWFSSSTDVKTEQEKLQEMIDKIQIHFKENESQYKQQFLSLARKFSTIFATDLNEQPAKVDPYVISMEEDNTWYKNPGNKRSARLQSLSKQYAIKQFIDKAIANKIIKPSQATAWSQILLTPKPDGSWRFCVDFRALNAATKSYGWPIPNIKQLLQRIGSKNAKYYAVLDLTAGYNQAPLSEESTKFTAFLCSEGLYEWLRLPMGLKGAGSFYQSQMYNKVLKDLVQKICEVYMDDIITFAQTPEELLQRLEIIFARLKQFGITVNPKKVKIGMTEVEYVGHLIDEHGLSFTKEKRDKVLDFRKPNTAKEMKSFLGLTNQFRDHVPEYGDLVAPLHEMIPNYEKNSSKPLKWTDQLDKAFYSLQKQVSECQKIFFMDDHSPVYLHTDASNYGIGAYLFQVIDGKRIPIRFISRTLNKTERKWNTVEKEAYAIFYSITQLEHLLGNRQFTLKTDAKNLTYMNTEHTPKVKRWKLAIQHFDFDVQHIKGVDNIEADSFSRLVHFPKKDEAELMLNNAEMVQESTSAIDMHKISPAHYSSIKQKHGGIHGHGGVNRTLAILHKAGTKWKGIRKDVEAFVRRCPCCQKMSQIKPIINTKPYTLASYYPMQRICIDTIGPITVNNSNENESIEKYILVIIDAFSRYVNLYATKDTTASSALTALIDWVTTFGCPSEIVSDNGTQFANELITQFLDATDIEHNLIQAYSKEENGLVERANKEVNRHITAIVHDKMIKNEWKQMLPFVKRLMNSQVHSSIGVSPAQLIFGNSVNHESNILYPHAKKDEQTYNTHIQQLLQTQAKLIQSAQQTQYSTDMFHIAQRDINNPTVFPINSYVLAEYETSKKPSKFHTRLHGPYRVVAINKDNTVYTVQHLITNKNADYHIKFLREFKYDSNIDPIQAAKHDEEYDEIIEVLDHKFTNKKKLTRYLQFQLIWSRDKTPVWQQWNKTLAENEKIHTYLRNNQMRKFIPAKFTWPKDHPEYDPPIKKHKNTK